MSLPHSERISSTLLPATRASGQGPGPTLPAPAQLQGCPGSTHGSSWHQKWLTAKAIATRTRNTATAIRPCIQGCRFPRPGKGGVCCVLAGVLSCSKLGTASAGGPPASGQGPVLEAPSPLPGPEETVWGTRTPSDHWPYKVDSGLEEDRIWKKERSQGGRKPQRAASEVQAAQSVPSPSPLPLQWVTSKGPQGKPRPRDQRAAP